MENDKLSLLKEKIDEKLDKKTELCCICLSNVIKRKNKTITKCGHVFHSECIFRSLLDKKSCPICRQNLFSTISMKELYERVKDEIFNFETFIYLIDTLDNYASCESMSELISDADSYFEHESYNPRTFEERIINILKSKSGPNNPN